MYISSVTQGAPATPQAPQGAPNAAAASQAASVSAGQH